MAKAEIKGVLYRFGVYKASRGYCNDCSQKSDTILIRIFSPQDKKVELRICYSCLIEYLFEIKRKRLVHDKVDDERIEKARLKALEKARAKKQEKKEKESGKVLPELLADAKGGEPATPEKNDGGGDKDGGSSANALAPVVQNANPK